MKRLLFQAVLMLFLCMSSYAYAETLQKVTINGKTLDKIDDIVMEVTGTHTVTKKSFLKFRKDSDGGFKFIINWSDANHDGTDVKLNESKSYETGHAAGKTKTGIHPVVGKKRP
ncbi:MAG: hypothetical protein IJL18_08440, partial [Synergistaceae bacterium]|nr:hypothetical protein [Synergistaceae bacterium]